jgi:hypothetical protein
MDKLKELIAKLSDLAVELEKHSNDHIHDEIPDNLQAAVEGVCADRINAILKPYRQALATMEQPGEKSLRLRHALKAILEIGKRDLSNPKYDGYFEEARLAIILCEIDGTLSKIEGEEVV